jgi:hypothetical protein
VPAAIAAFAGHKMTAARTSIFELARSSNLYSLGQPFMGFQFRHLVPQTNMLQKNEKHEASSLYRPKLQVNITVQILSKI